MFQAWTPSQLHYAQAARPAGRGWARLAVALGLVFAIAAILADTISPIAWLTSVPMVALVLYCANDVMPSRAEPVAAEVLPVPGRKITQYRQMQDWHTEQFAELAGMCTGDEARQMRIMLTRIERVWARLWVEHDALSFELGRLGADVPQTAAQTEQMRSVGRRREVIVARADRLEQMGRTLPERIGALAAGGAPDAVHDGLRLAMVEAQFGIDELAS